MRLAFSLPVLSAMMILCSVVGVRGQQPIGPSTPAPATVPASGVGPKRTDAAAPVPIPLADVAAQADSTKISLRTVEADLSSDHVTAAVEVEMRAFSREINARLEESSKILTASPSLDTLRDLESGWQQVSVSLYASARDVNRRAALMDRDHTRLTELLARWDETLRLAQRTDATAAIQTAETVRESIRKTLADVEKRQARVTSLLNRIAEQRSRVTEMRYSLQQARDEVIDRLFTRDSPPLWSASVLSRARLHLWEENRTSLSSQVTALGAYTRRKLPQFLEHLFVILMLMAGLYRIRWRARSLVQEEPDLTRAALIFEAPGATAVVLSILLSAWIYPQAPRLLRVILGAGVLFPTVLILRRLLERPLYPILNALVTFYLIDQMRTIAAASPALSRLLFLGEFLGGVVFLGRLIKSARLSKALDARADRLSRTIRTGARIALAAGCAALIANVLGYVNLANYLGNVVLRSADMAAVLYTALHIADGMVVFAMRVWPLKLLDLVRRHHLRLHSRLRSALQIGAVVLWTLFTLEQLALRSVVIQKVDETLNAGLAINSFHITLGRMLAFIITVWAAFMLSGFLRFLLDEDVYPRVNLGHGIPYAISSVLHYVILLTGFYIAIAALGFDMTKFTILAGAFGVGFGFGLQNIVNNFVSGLILLFERPVKVGDVLQLDDGTGAVTRIGIRASIIRMTNGSEIILPNSKLISEKVTNWTFSNSMRSIMLPVSVPSGTDPSRVIELLKGVADAHPLVARTPPPEALFAKFSTGTFDFELHAWTDHFTEWERIRSDLATTIHTVFAEHDIAIP